MAPLIEAFARAVPWLRSRRLSTRRARASRPQLERLLAFEAAQDEARRPRRPRDPRRRARARRRGAGRVHRALRPLDAAQRAAISRSPPARAHARAASALARAEREALELAAGAHPRLPRAPARRSRGAVEEADGTVLGQQVTPLDRVGLYVPGGKAAYPSSVLMNAVAAKVAGVPELVMVTPDARRRRVNARARGRGARGRRPHRSRRRRAGVGALAYGTATRAAGRQDRRPRQRLRRRGQAPRVRPRRHRHGRRPLGDPGHRRRAAPTPTGSRWTCSRRPSTTRSRRRSCSRPTRPCSTRVGGLDARQLPADAAARDHRGLARRARRADRRCATSSEACELANRIAPEHLELAVDDPEALLPRIRHAGAIFLGHHASEALGDYCAGPEPRAADVAHRALLLAARRLRFPEALERDPRVAPRAPRTLGRAAATLAHGGRASTRTRAARRCGSEERAVSERTRETWSAPRSSRSQAYHVPPAERHGEARRDGEPLPLPDGARGGAGRAPRARSRSTAIPIRRAPALKARLREALGIPDGLGDRARQRLRRDASRCSSLALARPGRRGARAGAVVRHVPAERAWPRDCATSACRCAPTSRSTRTAMLAAIAAPPAGAHLARLSEQSHRQPVPARGDRAHRRAPRRGWWSSTRRTTRSPAAPRCSTEVGRHPNLLVMRTLSKLGLAGLRLGLAAGPARLDRTSSRRCACPTT